MNAERVRISWNLAEASKQCCLCSLSSALLPGPNGLMERASASIQKVLGSNPSWILDFFPMDLFLPLSAINISNYRVTFPH